MSSRVELIRITQVGQTYEPLSLETGRGVLTIDSVLEYASYPPKPYSNEIIIDMAKVGWVGFFEWNCLMALLHRRLQEDPHLKICLDFVGKNKYGLIPYQECATYLKNKHLVPDFPRSVYINSYIAHHVLNFVKSIEGPDGFANVANGRLTLGWLSAKEAGRPGWYHQDRAVEDSVFFPRTSVSAAEMCIQFTSRNQVDAWRQGMREKRIPDAAIFSSDEFWRILCHELARNVCEHADGPGFLSARVVLPSKGAVPRWRKEVLAGTALEDSKDANEDGFLELCVCDAGVGIPATVSTSFGNRFRERHAGADPPDNILPFDLLKFAFDELGTRKDRDQSWLTDRHALGHILFLVGKYSGALTLRSGKCEVRYAPKDGAPRRCRNQLGYEPDATRVFDHELPGTHIHIVIPLTAKRQTLAACYNHIITQHLPESYHIDPKHPIGPLVPVREKLDVLASCVSGEEVRSFQESCRALAKSLLPVSTGEGGGHPRQEIIVFDFAEIDWPPPRFETFLYLFQNVIIGRPVMFTNMEEAFAARICAFEENAKAPSYLPSEMQDEISNRRSDREFNEGVFLETYSGIGALVLGLGPEKGEYIFGLRDGKLRTALMKIVAGEKCTAEELAHAHGLDLNSINAVLSAASTLFRCQRDSRWELAWPRGDQALNGSKVDSLEVQRLRSIIANFDRAASNCKAWRLTAHSHTSRELVPARFYLPSEDTVYLSFFESSRILARDRYVTEVAERLIHRIFYGLTNLCNPPRKLSDVRILACSTTPSVMLAQAVRRAWPVDAEGERPVVIDYGPALFAGADPARMPPHDRDHCAVIIHDFFDEGRLSSELLAMTQTQGIDVLLEACFVRFLKPDERGLGDSVAYAAAAGWKTLNMANGGGLPVHAMVGITPREKRRREDVLDWGTNDEFVDHVVDPRSLRPVPIRSLRLESGVSDDRSLTKRDPYLKELDTDHVQCQLAAGHFVYGQRHFGVVADIRGIVTGPIGHRLKAWLADICCDEKDRNIPTWEHRENSRIMPKGAVTAILMPLHSQIHYLLPGLQMELAQRGKRVPHFFLDATSFGGGVETYDAPYQLVHQIKEAAQEIKRQMDDKPDMDPSAPEIVSRQLRLLIIDDAVFSGRTIQTLVDSIGKRHLPLIRQNVYRGNTRYANPIQWIRVFAVLNQLPTAKSAMWYQLTKCSVCDVFRFDAYAPFVGVATYTSHDCPICRELDHLEHIERRAEASGAGEVADWLKKRRDALLPLSTEAPSFGNRPVRELPEAVDVLSSHGITAPDRYNPVHADSAIWRFLELIHLSYPLGDILGCLKTTRESGARNPTFTSEYARFRLGVYDWCLHNWHQVHIYRVKERILAELKVEIEAGEPCFAEIIYRMRNVLMEDLHLGFREEAHESHVFLFIKWVVDLLEKNDPGPQTIVCETTLLLDVVLTSLFLDIGPKVLRDIGLLKHLEEAKDRSPRPLSFVSLLYLRLTRPEHVADPLWGLTTIAQTFYRGHHGRTPEERRRSDHQLLGRLAEDFVSNTRDLELRQRLGGCLHAFQAAVDNLRPYFGGNFLYTVADPAKQLQIQLSQDPESPNTQGLAHNLVQSLHTPGSFADFEESCHIATGQLILLLESRLVDLKKSTTATGDGHQKNPYITVDMRSCVDEQVVDWFLMTHIPDLIAFLSNIAFEPAKDSPPSGSSQIRITKDTSERPNMIVIETLTHFGPPSEAVARLNERSPKIARERDRLRLFGVIFEDAVIQTTHRHDSVLLRLHVPVGFKRNGG